MSFLDRDPGHVRKGHLPLNETTAASADSHREFGQHMQGMPHDCRSRPTIRLSLERDRLRFVLSTCSAHFIGTRRLLGLALQRLSPATGNRAHGLPRLLRGLSHRRACDFPTPREAHRPEPADCTRKTFTRCAALRMGTRALGPRI